MERSQHVRINTILDRIVSETNSDMKQDILAYLESLNDCDTWFYDNIKCRQCSWDDKCNNDKYFVKDLEYTINNIDTVLFMHKARGEQNGTPLP